MISNVVPPRPATLPTQRTCVPMSVQTGALPPPVRKWPLCANAGAAARPSVARTATSVINGPSPVDRARTGSKHHVITDGGGIPLAATLTGGQRHDVTQLMPLIEAIPPVRGRRGRPRRRPETLYAGRAYDYDKYRDLVRAKGIQPHIARRGTGHGSGFGVYRWVAEQAIALLHWFRRLRIRWEIRDDIHEAFLSITCSIICWRRLKNNSLC